MAPYYSPPQYQELPHISTRVPEQNLLNYFEHYFNYGV